MLSTFECTNGDICIDVSFHDGDEDETATLSYQGPQVDQNLFGYLVPSLDEVFVSGNWKRGSFDNSSEYSITVFSSRIKKVNRFFRHDDGLTSVVRIKSYEVDNVEDKESHKSVDNLLNVNTVDLENIEQLPNVTLIMNIYAFYDANFKRSFRFNSDSIVRRILHKVNEYFIRLSPRTKIKLITVGSESLPITRECHADNDSRQKLGAEISKSVQTRINHFEETDYFVVFCLPDKSNEIIHSDRSIASGYSKVGTICDESVKEKIAIVEYTDDSIDQTALITAHELGHSLGMEHDFDRTVYFPEQGGLRTLRRSNNGKLCTDVGGIMDYIPKNKISWTQCSLEDFRLYYNQVISKGIESFCLGSESEKEGRVCTHPGADTELKCDLSNCGTSIVGVIWHYTPGRTEDLRDYLSSCNVGEEDEEYYDDYDDDYYYDTKEENTETAKGCNGVEVIRHFNKRVVFNQLKNSFIENHFESEDITITYDELTSHANLYIRQAKQRYNGNFTCEIKTSESNTTSCSKTQTTFLEVSDGCNNKSKMSFFVTINI